MGFPGMDSPPDGIEADEVARDSIYIDTTFVDPLLSTAQKGIATRNLKNSL